MKSLKKFIAVLLIVAIAISMFAITASAESIGTVIFSPFILIDTLLYPIFGFHVLYWQWN